MQKLEHALNSEHSSTTSASTVRYTALERLVNGVHVTNELRFLLEHPRADVTLEGLDVTNAMYNGQVLSHALFHCELPTANLTLVSGVRVFGSAAALSMCRVVVSADR